MAWIETERGTEQDEDALFIANFDNVLYLIVTRNAGITGGYILNARMTDGYSYMTVAASQNRETLNRLAIQIAQIAQSNAYISQDAIREAMDVAQDN